VNNLSEITTIVADGQARQLAQFKDSNVQTVLGIFLAQVQELETVIVQGLTKTYLANATGWMLEQWGAIVGEPRPAYGDAATDDDIYRGLIYARIAINNSLGTLPDVYKILRLLQASQPKVREIYPATDQVEYTGTPFISGEQIRAVLELATAPIAFNITEYPETGGFCLDGGRGLGLDDGILAISH